MHKDIVVGIDLGTTYSLVADKEGIVVGLTDSAVDVEARESSSRHTTGANIVSSYKTDMGLGSSGEGPVDCSAITLKSLMNKYKEIKGTVFDKAVISVPAYFTGSQREAVYVAAKKAGIQVASLINEPTAGAICVCKTFKDLVVVYDLGGGTFDVSIIDSRAGAYSVIATDGCVIGGDNLDNAICEHIFDTMKVKILNRNANKKKVLRSRVVKAKESIQKTKQDVVISMDGFGVEEDFTLTVDLYKSIVKEVFWPTVEKTKYIINTNIPDVEKPKMVYIGGSTMCPFLRELLRAEIDFEELPSNEDPSEVVAKGVGMYADMVSDGIAMQEVEDITKQLGIETDNGTILPFIEEGTQVPCSNTVAVDNADDSRFLSLSLYQGNNMLAKLNDHLGELKYDYGREVARHQGLLEVTVSVSADGMITVSANEPLMSDEPQEIKLTRR